MQLGNFGQEAPKQADSIYKQLIMPLLSAVECGGFFIFASPLIYIQGYTDEGLMQDELSECRDSPSDRGMLADDDLL